MEPLCIESNRTAVLCMDFQVGIVQMLPADAAETLLECTAALLDAARKAKAMVGYVRVGFRPGYPEVSANNQSFNTIRASGRFESDAPGTEIHPQVAPQPGEFVVVKHCVGAFHGTDLDMILRANGIDTLVLAGIATSGVVLSTLRHAADSDYRIVVVADCCADADAEVHRKCIACSPKKCSRGRRWWRTAPKSLQRCARRAGFNPPLHSERRLDQAAPQSGGSGTACLDPPYVTKGGESTPAQEPQAQRLLE